MNWCIEETEDNFSSWFNELIISVTFQGKEAAEFLKGRLLCFEK